MTRNYSYGSDAGSFKITSNFGGNSFCGASPIMLMDTPYNPQNEKSQSEEVTPGDTVGELYNILDLYEQIQFEIENKVFIRKKKRRIWLEDNQRAIDALYIAIDALQNEGEIK